MRRPQPFVLDTSTLRSELSEFAALLAQPERELSEQRDIAPLFRKNRNLAALLGFYNARLVTPNVCESELGLHGDQTCDLVIGHTEKSEYCFVEFEDARRNSVFSGKSKGTRDWSARLEHGFGQIVDWFRTLDVESRGDVHSEFFGGPFANYGGLLVIGRDAFLDRAGEPARLLWRSQHVLVNSKPVWILTFDQLYRDLEDRVRLLAPLPRRTAKGAGQPKHKRKPK
jgi:hypothetical protein